MSLKKVYYTAGLLSLLTAPTFAEEAKTEAKPLTRTEVQGIVREFIEKNPQVVLESLAKYTAEAQKAQALAVIRPHTPTIGSAEAPVTIVEFSEFQCPFCRRAQETLQELRKRYKSEVRFAYKHLPLPFHKEAEPAAKAAQAAHLQGKFWEYSDELWRRQQYLGEKLYVDIAKDLKLDMDKFNEDRASKQVELQVRQDLADGANAGAEGTPFFLINGTPMSGALPVEQFVEAIEAALKDAKTEE